MKCEDGQEEPVRERENCDGKKMNGNLLKELKAQAQKWWQKK